MSKGWTHLLRLLGVTNSAYKLRRNTMYPVTFFILIFYYGSSIVRPSITLASHVSWTRLQKSYSQTVSATVSYSLSLSHCSSWSSCLEHPFLFLSLSLFSAHQNPPVFISLSCLPFLFSEPALFPWWDLCPYSFIPYSPLPHFFALGEQLSILSVFVEAFRERKPTYQYSHIIPIHMIWSSFLHSLLSINTPDHLEWTHLATLAPMALEFLLTTATAALVVWRNSFSSICSTPLLYSVSHLESLQ